MHEAVVAFDDHAIGIADALVAEAYAEERGFTCEVLDDIVGDAAFFRGAGAG